MKFFIPKGSRKKNLSRIRNDFADLLEKRAVEVVRFDLTKVEEIRRVRSLYSTGDCMVLFLDCSEKSKVQGYAEYYEMFPQGDIFPNKLGSYLFADKKRQASFLEQHEHPCPLSCWVESKEDVRNFLQQKQLSLPLISKKRASASSKGVSLFETLEQYVTPVLLQEYCVGNECDYRIVVLGDVVTGYKRWNRPGDFRASGSGLFVSSVLPEQMRQVALDVCRKHNFVAASFDMLWKEDTAIILEMDPNPGRKGMKVIDGLEGHWKKDEFVKESRTYLDLFADAFLGDRDA